MTTNGVLLAEHAAVAPRRRPAPRDREPRHAATRALPRAHAPRRPTPRCSRASPPCRAPGSRTRSSTPSSCAASTTTSSADLIEFGRGVPAEVRFIEYMDVGGATRWSMEQVVSRAGDPRARSRRRYGRIEPVVEDSHGAGRSLSAARRHGRSGSSRRRRRRSAPTATAAASPPTACGTSASTRRGHRSARPAARAAPSTDELTALITGRWQARTDRGAEERLAVRDRVAARPDRRAASAIRTSRCTRAEAEREHAADEDPDRRPRARRQPADLRPPSLRAAAGLHRLSRTSSRSCARSRRAGWRRSSTRTSTTRAASACSP